jgi:hypothetical protein
MSRAVCRRRVSFEGVAGLAEQPGGAGEGAHVQALQLVARGARSWSRWSRLCRIYADGWRPPVPEGPTRDHLADMITSLSPPRPRQDSAQAA